MKIIHLYVDLKSSNIQKKKKKKEERIKDRGYITLNLWIDLRSLFWFGFFV